MTVYTVRPIKGRHPWLVRPMPGRGARIAGVMIHATRSGAAAAEHDDGPGTENWALHPDNGSAAQGSGAFWDELIWRRDGTRILSTDYEREFPTWCAGMGDAGTWAASDHYYQVEVSQSRITQSYSAVSIDSLAQSVAEKALKHDFPIVRIPFLTQRGTPPRGICTHEDSANGRRLGKSDPGPLFPWDDFLARARAYLEEDEVSRQEYEDLLLAMFAGGEEVEGEPPVLVAREERLRRAVHRLEETAAGRRTSVNDAAVSALVVALRADGVPVEDMDDAAVRGLVRDELRRARIAPGGE